MPCRLGVGLKLCDAGPVWIPVMSWSSFSLWGNYGTTIADGAVAGPQVGSVAAKISEAAIDGTHSVETVFDIVIGTRYRYVIVAAPGVGLEDLYIATYDGVIHAVFVNLTTGICSIPYGNVISVTATDAGNGYKTIEMIFDATASVAANIAVYLSRPAGTLSYLGDVTKNFKLFSAAISKQ